MEYLQWLQDEMLEEEAALLKRAERSQVAGSKHKEVTTRDEEVQQPSKKARCYEMLWTWTIFIFFSFYFLTL